MNARTGRGHAAALRGFAFAEDGDAADLAAYLARLLRHDPDAAVRLQSRGAVLGVFARPPFGVIALRAVALAEPARIDRTVPAGQLRDRLRRGALSELPDPVTGPAWAGLLPPATGWRRLAVVPAGSLARAVDQAVTEFRTRTEALVGAERSRSRLDGLAEEVWSRPVLAEVPLRAAHASKSLGFLTTHGVATVYRTAGWLRLDATHGTVAVRLAPATLSLQVV